MGRKKGTPTRFWSVEAKERIILEALENGLTKTSRKYDASPGMVSNWIKSYQENNNKVVDNRYKRRNPLSKYQNKKSLSKLEELEYQNMKLKIENERLKKGYMVKGDGSVVIFKK